MPMLPTEFIPSRFDVICGRSKANYYHAGNEYFREIVATSMERYLCAKTKTEKGCVIVSVVEAVRSGSPQAGFVRQDPRTGRWIVVDDATAREKVGATMRSLIKISAMEKSPFCEASLQSSKSSPPNNWTTQANHLLDWIPPSIVANICSKEGDKESSSSLTAGDCIRVTPDLSACEIFEAAMWRISGLELNQDELNRLIEGSACENEPTPYHGSCYRHSYCSSSFAQQQQIARSNNFAAFQE